MLKRFFGGALAAILAAGCVSCSNDDPEPVIDPELETVSTGAFILNQGNLTNQIEGSLTYIDYATGTASQKLYMNANGGQSLGNTPQTAIVYGSKIYFGIYKSNVITVADARTMRMIKQISLADNDGQSPRSMVADDGKVYISMYNGYVSRLDTLSLAIDGNVKVGPNPEIIAIEDDKIYVPNSDGMNWQVGYGTTASVIDTKTFSSASTITVGLNPCKFLIEEDEIFLLCNGNYGDVASKVYRLDPATNVSTEIGVASIAAAGNDKIYLADAPWKTFGADVKYQVYDIKSRKLSAMTFDKYVDSPVEMAVDPVTGHIFITSYVIDGGKAATTLDGYCHEYTADGKFLARYEAGVGPAWIFFNVKEQ